jgi:hypothetical protein
MVNVGISRALELTPVKVKEIIAEKVNEVLDTWTSAGNTELSEPDKKKLAESRPMVVHRFLINGISREGKHYIAAVTLNMPEMPTQPFIVNLKMKKGKSGWGIHEVQAVGGRWVPVKTAVSEALQYLKALFDKVKQRAAAGDKHTGSLSAEEEAKVELFKSKQKTVMLNLRDIGMAIEMYMCDVHHAPKVNSIRELKKIIEPVYIKTAQTHDPWGHKYHYKVDKDNPRKYWLASGGSDGKLAGFEQMGIYIVYTFQDFAFDIIYSNRKFIFRPRVHGDD